MAGGAVAPHQENVRTYLSLLNYFFLYMGDICEGVRSLPLQTKSPRYGPGYGQAPADVANMHNCTIMLFSILQ